MGNALVELGHQLLPAYFILNTKVAWTEPEFIREYAVGVYI
jgi:hypothetical protein